MIASLNFACDFCIKFLLTFLLHFLKYAKKKTVMHDIAPQKLIFDKT